MQFDLFPANLLDTVVTVKTFTPDKPGIPSAASSRFDTESAARLDEASSSFNNKQLHFMASQPGIVFSRDQLLDEVWEHDATVNSRTVDVHINKIRKKIGDEWIETVTGVGYRFRE